MNVRLLRHGFILALVALGLGLAPLWKRLLPLGLLAAVLVSGVVQAQELLTVRATYYLDRGVTYSGGTTFSGVAACSWGFEMGTRLRFLEDGREVVCLDRGQLGNGRGWIDVWVSSAAEGRALARTYGDRMRVEVVP